MNEGISTHYRKDHPKGITPPNPDAERDIVQHITKHRGLKTPYTSVSEDAQCIRHFEGSLYATEPEVILRDGHHFHAHSDIVKELTSLVQSSTRNERILAARALHLAARAKEALIDWQFDLTRINKKARITWCAQHIQSYFQKISS